MRESDPPARTTTSTSLDPEWKRASDDSAIVRWRYSMAYPLTRSSSAPLHWLRSYRQGRAAERPKHVSSADKKKKLQATDVWYIVCVLVCMWYLYVICICVCICGCRMIGDCVIFVLLIPACLFYLTRTLGRNRHAICRSPMIVMHTYIYTSPYLPIL